MGAGGSGHFKIGNTNNNLITISSVTWLKEGGAAWLGGGGGLSYP